MRRAAGLRTSLPATRALAVGALRRGLEDERRHVKRGRHPGTAFEAAQRRPRFGLSGNVTLREGRHHTGDRDALTLRTSDQRRRGGHCLGTWARPRAQDVDFPLASGAAPRVDLRPSRDFGPPCCRYASAAGDAAPSAPLNSNEILGAIGAAVVIADFRRAGRDVPRATTAGLLQYGQTRSRVSRTSVDVIGCP